MDIPCTESRSTTFRLADEEVGKEADTSFYIAHEEMIRDKDEIDLAVDPPPDLAIEVDNLANSLGKLPIYAALRVPEVWRYDARAGVVWFGRLQHDGTYTSLERSECLPMMTPARVLEALALCQGLPESRWGRRLQEWIRGLRALTASLLLHGQAKADIMGALLFSASPPGTPTLSAPRRIAEIERKTRETEIRLRLDLDGQGQAEVATGIGFLDHMLELFARHALVDLTVGCTGDLHVDGHHTTEDVGICLGQAIDRALGDRSGIRRYGHSFSPWTKHSSPAPSTWVDVRTGSGTWRCRRPRSARSTANWSPISGRRSPLKDE